MSEGNHLDSLLETILKAILFSIVSAVCFVFIRLLFGKESE